MARVPDITSRTTMAEELLAERAVPTTVMKVLLQCNCGHKRWLKKTSMATRAANQIHCCVKCSQRLGRMPRPAPEIGAVVHGFVIAKHVGWRYLLTCQTCGDARWMSEATLRNRLKPCAAKYMRCSGCESSA